DKVKANSPPAKIRTTSIQDVPTEVLEHIVSFLPQSAIPKLMVNRAFRETCERILYRNIHLLHTPGRTLHLCKTFVLRPDLALVVRDLEVRLEWFHVTPKRGTRVHTLPRFSDKTKTKAFNPVEALSLAQNVTSFTARGIVWAADNDMAPVRDLVCGMKLTRLKINVFPSLPNPNRDYDEEIMSYLCAILQAQPLLEHLTLPSTFIIDQANFPSPTESLPPWETPDPLIINWPEIPNLRSLGASVSVAASLISAAPKMEELSMSSWSDGNKPWPADPELELDFAPARVVDPG
ncbi:hypothetical protein FRC01_009410, partial [Tulasnella sp. 417]